MAIGERLRDKSGIAPQLMSLIICARDRSAAGRWMMSSFSDRIVIVWSTACVSMQKRVSLLGLATLCLLACSPVRYTPLAGVQRSPLPRHAAVDVLVTGRPRCAYDEIGLMRMKSR